jgi:hypothetical protein
MLYKITNNLIAVDPKRYLTPQPYLTECPVKKITISYSLPETPKINTFTGIYRPTKMFRCSDLGSVV